jgi:hypothetical protein
LLIGCFTFFANNDELEGGVQGYEEQQSSGRGSSRTASAEASGKFSKSTTDASSAAAAGSRVDKISRGPYVLLRADYPVHTPGNVSPSANRFSQSSILA